MKEYVERSGPWLRTGGYPLFTPDQVRSIRNRVASGEASQYRLAREYGVSAVAISKVVRRLSHKGVA